jgi:hypothetical protein
LANHNERNFLLQTTENWVCTLSTN